VQDVRLSLLSKLTHTIRIYCTLKRLKQIDSLNATMEYLENMSQTSKLLRYLRLRSVLLFSILFAVILAVFGIVDNYDEGIVDQEQAW
jgi:hypothetical protein